MEAWGTPFAVDLIDVRTFLPELRDALAEEPPCASDLALEIAWLGHSARLLITREWVAA